LGLVLGLFVGSAEAVVRHNDGNDQDYIAYGNQFSSTLITGWLDWSENTSAYRASSVVIDDGHWVVTAAHNFFNSSGQPLYEGAFIGTGSDGYTDPGDWYIADQWFCHPGYTEPAYSADIALLYFEQPILGVEYAQRYRGTLSVGDLTSIVGFGRPGTPATGYLPTDWKRRGCENNIQYVGGVPTFPEYAMFSDFFPAGDSRYNPVGGLGAPGDSGGGWYDEDGLLIGISSAVTGYGYYHSTIGMDITHFNAWIDEVQASIPEPGTLILLGFGAVLLGRRRA